MSCDILHNSWTNKLEQINFGQHARTHIAQDVWLHSLHLIWFIGTLYKWFITRKSLQEFLSLPNQCSHHENFNPPLAACTRLPLLPSTWKIPSRNLNESWIYFTYIWSKVEFYRYIKSLTIQLRCDSHNNTISH